MNAFRLFLCLVGLMTFLVIRNTTKPTKAPQQSPLLAPNFAFPPFPETGASLDTNGQLVVDRLELDGQIVNLRQSPQGLRYDLTTIEGQAVASNLSERQLQQQHPALYGLVQVARTPPQR